MTRQTRILVTLVTLAPPPCFRVLYYIITIIKYKVLCVKINIDEWTIYDDEIEKKSA